MNSIITTVLPAAPVAPAATSTTHAALAALTDRFARLIEHAPNTEPAVATPAKEAGPPAISTLTGVPARYRDAWQHPTDDATWQHHFQRTLARVRNRALIALIGPRGTGKTRLAAETLRHTHPLHGTYTTAMGLFLRLRASYQKSARETELAILGELTRTPLLILDEIQERAESAWEDRMLTHLLDARYGAMRPTLVIANLTRQALPACLGESITSRLIETGGVLEITGPSHRVGRRV